MCVLLGLVALSFLQIYSGQFAALAASRKAIQAQQYAQSAADLLRNTAYDKLPDAAHAKQAITGGNGWMSEISISAETTVNEVPQRMGTIKIYRNSTVTSPDFSLQVPLSSAGNSSKGFPDWANGQVLQYTQSPNWQTFVMPENGYIAYALFPPDGSGYNKKGNIIINGVLVASYSFGSTYDLHSGVIPVSKGDKVSFRAPWNYDQHNYIAVGIQDWIKFFPCKK